MSPSIAAHRLARTPSGGSRRAWRWIVVGGAVIALHWLAAQWLAHHRDIAPTERVPVQIALLKPERVEQGVAQPASSVSFAQSAAPYAATHVAPYAVTHDATHATNHAPAHDKPRDSHVLSARNVLDTPGATPAKNSKPRQLAAPGTKRNPPVVSRTTAKAMHDARAASHATTSHAKTKPGAPAAPHPAAQTSANDTSIDTNAANAANAPGALAPDASSAPGMSGTSGISSAASGTTVASAQASVTSNATGSATSTPGTSSAPAKTAASHGAKFSVPPSGDLRYDTFYNGVRNQSGTIHWKSTGKQYEMVVAVPIPFIGTFSRTSRGHIDAFGLAPDQYVERLGHRREDTTTFNRASRQIAFTRTSATLALPDGAQDRFSVVMQLASLVRGDPHTYRPGVTREFYVADNDSGESWPVMTIGDESVRTDQGFVAARHFRRLPRHDGDRRRIDIWLAPSLGWLPVRMLQTEPNGTEFELVWRGPLALPDATQEAQGKKGLQQTKETDASSSPASGPHPADQPDGESGTKGGVNGGVNGDANDGANGDVNGNANGNAGETSAASDAGEAGGVTRAKTAAPASSRLPATIPAGAAPAP